MIRIQESVESVQKYTQAGGARAFVPWHVLDMMDGLRDAGFYLRLGGFDTRAADPSQLVDHLRNHGISDWSEAFQDFGGTILKLAQMHIARQIDLSGIDVDVSEILRINSLAIPMQGEERLTGWVFTAQAMRWAAVAKVSGRGDVRFLDRPLANWPGGPANLYKALFETGINPKDACEAAKSWKRKQILPEAAEIRLPELIAAYEEWELAQP